VAGENTGLMVPAVVVRFERSASLTENCSILGLADRVLAQADIEPVTADLKIVGPSMPATTISLALFDGLIPAVACWQKQISIAKKRKFNLAASPVIIGRFFWCKVKIMGVLFKVYSIANLLVRKPVTLKSYRQNPVDNTGLVSSKTTILIVGFGY